jgi:ribosome biogenesis GTPase A
VGIEWYPGHMARAARRIREDLRSTDVVLEVVDARIAQSGRNPALDRVAVSRTRVVALTRQDLADPTITKAWLGRLARRGTAAIAVDGRAPRSVARLVPLVTRSPALSHNRGIARAMIVGVPNSGKSSILNALLRRAAARTEARAGVTRHAQWFRLAPSVELMDTPGVLPPKIADAEAQWKLAICGAVPSDRYDPQEVAEIFHRWLIARTPRTHVPDLATFAARRGFKQRGGSIDYHNAAQSYIRAFNDGAFGRISLESPDDGEAA